MYVCARTYIDGNEKYLTSICFKNLVMKLVYKSFDVDICLSLGYVCMFLHRSSPLTPHIHTYIFQKSAVRTSNCSEE